jgi:hypothetical protein
VQAPDPDNAQELERHHENPVRGQGGAVSEQGLEAEQKHGAGRVLGLRVAAVDELVPVDPVGPRVAVSGRPGGDVRDDDGDVKDEGDRDDRCESELRLAPPRVQQGAAGASGSDREPGAVASSQKQGLAEHAERGRRGERCMRAERGDSHVATVIRRGGIGADASRRYGAVHRGLTPRSSGESRACRPTLSAGPELLARSAATVRGQARRRGRYRRRRRKCLEPTAEQPHEDRRLGPP